MGGLRLCHLSDLHLGYRKYSRLTRGGLNQREVDVHSAFRECVDRVIGIKPDVVVIAGDLFHQVRPSNAVVTSCFRELRRLTQGIGAPVILIAGNHETPKRVDTGCILRLFSEIPSVYVADTKVETFTFPDRALSVRAVPHAALFEPHSSHFRSEDSSRFNVLVTHAQVGEGWMSEFGGVSLPLTTLSPHQWDYVALGHVHVRRELALGCWYSGAIEHTANDIWSEARENKGFLEVELPSKKVVFHQLTSPRVVVALDPIDAEGRDAPAVQELIREALGGVAGGLEGKIVRLQVVNVPRGVFRDLDHREIRALRASALHLSLEIRPPQVLRAPSSLRRRGRFEDDLKVFCDEWRGKSPAVDLFSRIKRYIDGEEGSDEAPLT